MKITANRAELAEAAAWVATAIPKRPQAPALAGMRIVACQQRQQVDLVAFDWEVSHRATIDVEVAEGGEVLASGHLVRELLGAMKGKQVDLVADEQKLTVQAGRSTYRTNLLELGDYPTLPEMPDPVGEVAVDDLATLVRSTKHVVDDAAHIDGIRGLRLETDADETTLRAVGLSQPSMATAVCDWQGSAFDCQVPVRGFDAAIRGLRGTAAVGFRDGMLSLDDGRQAVTLRTFVGQFADWRRVLRDDSPVTATLDVAELLDAVKRASLTCADEDPIFLVVRGDCLEVVAGSSEKADGTELVDATCGGETEVGFSAQILSAALGAVGAGSVTLGLAGPGKALVITADDHPSTHLVMPRRVERGQA